MREVLIHPGSVFEKRGLFHGWGLVCADSVDGNMTESIAIIEFNDGSVTTIPPHLVKFLASPEPAHAALRDQLAAQVISTAFASPDRRFFCQNQDKEAAWAYEVADAMLIAREAKP